MKIGIGIDTGGTCTDAVLFDMDKRQVLSWGKTQTTKYNLEKGIDIAVKTILNRIAASRDLELLKQEENKKKK